MLQGRGVLAVVYKSSAISALKYCFDYRDCKFLATQVLKSKIDLVKPNQNGHKMKGHFPSLHIRSPSIILI